MRNVIWNSIIALIFLTSLVACATQPKELYSETLIQGDQGLANFNQVGEADWIAIDGVIQASSGAALPGFLVTKLKYANFNLRVEFWASDDANSGIFFRCQQPNSITDENCYEANIFDQRPDPTYATGAIVKIAPIYAPHPTVGGKWNTYEITARNSRLTLVLNGVTTVNIEDAKFADGVIALQWGQGVIKFRKFEITRI